MHKNYLANAALVLSLLFSGIAAAQKAEGV